MNLTKFHPKSIANLGKKQ